MKFILYYALLPYQLVRLNALVGVPFFLIFVALIYFVTRWISPRISRGLSVLLAVVLGYLIVTAIIFGLVYCGFLVKFPPLFNFFENFAGVN